MRSHVEPAHESAEARITNAVIEAHRGDGSSRQPNLKDKSAYSPVFRYQSDTVLIPKVADFPSHDQAFSAKSRESSAAGAVGRRRRLDQLAGAEAQHLQMSPRGQSSLHIFAGRPRRRKGLSAKGYADALSVTSEESGAESVARSHASRWGSEARRAAVDRIDVALSSGDFSSQAIFARANGMSSQASSNGKGQHGSRRKHTEPGSTQNTLSPTSTTPRGDNGRSPIQEASMSRSSGAPAGGKGTVGHLNPIFTRGRSGRTSGSRPESRGSGLRESYDDGGIAAGHQGETCHHQVDCDDKNVALQRIADRAHQRRIALEQGHFDVDLDGSDDFWRRVGERAPAQTLGASLASWTHTVSDLPLT